MRGTLFGLVSLFSLAIAPPIWAQTNVHVTETIEDQVGQRLAFVFREALRRSATFEDTYDQKSSFFSVSLITLDPDERANQTRTIYTFVITLTADTGFNRYVTSSVGFCGADVLTECADGLVQDLGVQLEKARKAGFKTD
jgi:hypothetical protein